MYWSTAVFFKKEIRELVCWEVALINGISTDRLKFWVKLHFDADSVMCSVHQLALETCDVVIKKKICYNTTVLAVLVNCMVYVEDFLKTVSTMRSCITYVTKKKKKKKLLLMHVQRTLLILHVCIFECLPWSTGVDIQFVRMLVCHREWSSHQASSLQNTTAKSSQCH